MGQAKLFFSGPAPETLSVDGVVSKHIKQSRIVGVVKRFGM